MSQRILSEGHKASYNDPIAVARGAALVITGREDIWDGHRWLWARAPDGREGWVPDSLPAETSAGTLAAYDYNAIELSCVAGERVEVLRQSHGWAWCRKDDGSEGWLPRRLLAGAFSS